MLTFLDSTSSQGRRRRKEQVYCELPPHMQMRELKLWTRSKFAFILGLCSLWEGNLVKSFIQEVCLSTSWFCKLLELTIHWRERKAISQTHKVKSGYGKCNKSSSDGELLDIKSVIFVLLEFIFASQLFIPDVTGFRLITLNKMYLFYMTRNEI